MSKTNANSGKPHFPLRAKAEAAVRTSPPDVARMTPAEIQNLVHELQVHQVELEMQNEELREAQTELARSRDRFVDLYDFSPAGYVTIDAEGVVLEANLTISLMLGTERQSLTGRRFTRYIVRSEQDTAYLHLRAALDTGARQVCDLILQRPDGTTFPVRVETIRIQEPGSRKTYFRSAILDITERKRAEHALARSHEELERRVAARTAELAAANQELLANQTKLRESGAQLARLAAIVESSGDAIVGRNLDDVVITWNAGAEQLFGYTEAEIAGKPFDILVPAEELPEYRQFMEQVRSGQLTESVEGVRLHKDGHRIHVSTRQSVIRNEKGEIVGTSAITRDVSLRKKAEAALMESEERYRLLFNTLIEGFCVIEMVFDAEGRPVDYRFLAVNPSFEKQTGLHDVEGRLVSEILPDNEAKWYDLYGRVAMTGEPSRFEREAVALGRWFEVSAFRFGADDRRKVAILFNDITESKRAQMALAKSEAQLHSFVEQAPVAIALYDRDMICLAASRHWTQLNSLLPGAGAGLAEQELHPALPDWWREVHRKALAGESHAGHGDLWELPGGKRMWLSWAVRPWRDEGGSIGGVLLMADDITARLEAEEKLREARRQIDYIREAIDHHSIVAVTDSQGVLTYVNDRFCETSGYSRAQLLGQTHRIVNSGRHPKAFFEELWGTIRAGGVWSGEIENRAQDGSHYFVATTIVPRLGANGKPEEFIAIRTDITELKRASAELNRLTQNLAAKNRDLETLIRAASHDLRTPLVNVQGFASVLGEQIAEIKELMRLAAGGHPPPHEAFAALAGGIDGSLGFISAGAEKMDALLRGLLIFSRLGTAAVAQETVDVDGLVRECLAATRFQIELSGADVTTGLLPPCTADSNLLGSVVSNLIDNAIKYRDPARPLRLDISGNVEGTRSIYRFTDNGLGIAPEHREVIFELFHRLNPRHCEGTGLGLTITRRALDRMDGSITVESAPGGGTVFIISLPATSASPVFNTQKAP